MAYTLTTPYQWQTWGTDYNTFTPYSRLAGRRFIGGTIDGPIAPSLTDVARGFPTMRVKPLIQLL
jgi:hypothetical protein